jgi:SAM-dependent methyltransferase
MRMLYGKASEGFFEELFTKHTYMHMTVLASLAEALGYEGSLEDLCSGSLLRVEVALPYLNWWRVALHGDLRDVLMEVLKDVVMRAGLIDWSLETAEDVFRSLYEFLIEPDTRRRLGEYYTPLWLVDMMVREFDMRERIVLDPFCGSGTFLIKIFHRKVDLGEDAEKAFSEVIGYDVNPLAIVVARAELIISYFRRAGREPDNPPLIYHIDTLAMWFGGESTLVPELTNLVSNAKSYLQMLINFNIVNVGKTADVLAKLRDLERSLTLSIRFAYSTCKTDVDCLERDVENYLLNLLANEEDAFIKSFIDHFKKHRISRIIANLINKYGGNDVWSVVLASIYAPILMTRFKPDIIITNPPWTPVTEFNAPYAENVRNYMLSKIKMRVSEKASQILAGADIAAAALGKSIKLAREGIAYIMNREQLFYSKSPSRAGILATYCILRTVLQNKRMMLKFFDIDFDAFQHGVYPAVIVVKRWHA